MRSHSKIKATFKIQQDQADCGVACLLSILQYHDGHSTFEKLRELSGTNTSGTTLLGLYQCAIDVGFTAEAFEASISNLKTFSEPCILHVMMAGSLQHYIVCYGFKDSIFIIGDPASGIVNLNENELIEIWKNNILLKLVPSTRFEVKKRYKKAKWEWFKQLIKDDINILSITIILGLLITLLSLANAIFYQKLIDNILPSGDNTKLITGLVLLFLILVIRSALSFIRQHYLLQQSKSFNNRIVRSFFSALIHLPKSFFDNRKTGDLIARMNDSAKIQKNIGYISGSVFIDIIILLATSAFLINYSLTIALITFSFIPIVSLTVLSYSRSIKTNQKQVMVANAVNESNYIDILDGIIVIKSGNDEIQFTNKIKSTYEALQAKVFGLGKLGNNFSVVNDIVGVILSLILITVSAYMVLNGNLKIGEMIAILSLTGALIPAVSRLSQINIQLQEASVAFDRLYEFTSIKPEYDQKELTPITFEKLKVDNVAFRFAGRRRILNDISFEVKKGEMIALLGESGCGKSTIIAMLQKFYQTEKGNIWVNDLMLSNLYTPSWRSIIATVPQEIKIFNGTVIDNISVGNVNADSTALIAFCNTVGLNTFFEDLPQGYFTIIGEEGINLSGGQKQLIALARALYRKPQVLLLDEATAAMDRNTERYVLKILEKLKSSMAIILITHKIQTAKTADSVYIIEGGKIQAHGAPSELMKSDNFFSQLVADAAF